MPHLALCGVEVGAAATGAMRLACGGQAADIGVRGELCIICGGATRCVGLPHWQLWTIVITVSAAQLLHTLHEDDALAARGETPLR